MSRLGNARVLTRRETGYEPPDTDADRVQAIIEERFPSDQRWLDFPEPMQALALLMSYTTCSHPPARGRPSSVLWETGRAGLIRGYRAMTKVTSSTSTTVSTVGWLLRASRKDEMLKRLSPDRRAAYERIRRLREELGPAPFSIVAELRDLRSHG